MAGPEGKVNPYKMLAALLVVGVAAGSQAEASPSLIIPAVSEVGGDLIGVSPKELLSRAGEWQIGQSLSIQLDEDQSTIEGVHLFTEGSLRYDESPFEPPVASINGTDINGEYIREGIEGDIGNHDIILDTLLPQFTREETNELTAGAYVKLEGGASFIIRYNPENVIYADGYTGEEYRSFDGRVWEGDPKMMDPVIIFENAQLIYVSIPEGYGQPETAYKIEQFFKRIYFHSALNPIKINTFDAAMVLPFLP